jgi:DNA helicase-2/ATP-dependent DNA helicase PcrA
MNTTEWERERERLETTKKVIERQIAAMREVVKDRKERVLDIRRHFWDEITVNVSTPDDLLETQASVIQQAMLLHYQERGHMQAEHMLRVLEKQRLSPYFGRIDFIEEHRGAPESYYFGISSLVDETTGKPLVFDWRAPISELFYDYGIGPAAYQAPEGTVRGENVLKRQYWIRDGKLEYMFDTGIQIVDEMLLLMLGKSADDRMKSIVTTIQKEQNEIIREDRYPLLIVQGVAGSGKTSVAMQRVAYLLYKYRHTLEADQLLLFSPNQLFNDYVSTVLPELGEQNMQQSTFQQYMEHRLDLADWMVEDAYDQLEALLKEEEPQYRIRLGGIRFKGSGPYAKLLEAYASYLKREGLRFKDFTVRSIMVISGRQLSDAFYGRNDHLPISRRLGKFQEWLRGELEDRQKELTRAYYRKLLKVPKYIGTEQELKTMSKKTMRRHFEPLYRMADEMKFIDLTETYRRLFDDAELFERVAAEANVAVPDDWEQIRKHTLEQLDRKVLPYEDGPPLLYLKELLEGVQTFHRIRHVIVDEAQDYTQLQFIILRRMFPRSRMTLLGDLNQGIYPHASQQNYEFVQGLFEEGQTKLFRLAKSYRSTLEIVEFTRRLLPSGESFQAFSRHGELPQVTPAASEDALAERIAADIRRLREEGAASIAVICKTAEESRRACAKLVSLDLTPVLVHKHMKTFVSGLLVIPAYLAKGLEFDAVIIYNAGADVYHREDERKLFYTACTRAMHRLHLYYTGELTPFIGADAAGTYEHAAAVYAKS